MIPSALLGSLHKFLVAELKLRFRTRLTQHLLGSFFERYAFFQVANVDSRMSQSNVEGVITQDVERVTDSLVDLFSNLAKPALDITLYSQQLRSIGRGPALLVAYLGASGALLNWVREPSVRLTASELVMESSYRAANSRLITNSEEIAFYAGQGFEFKTILGTFHHLTQLLRTSKAFRQATAVVDTLLAKYMATVVGFYIISGPFLSPKPEDEGRQLGVAEYYSFGRQLMKLASAMGRLVLAGRELSRLSGYSSRIGDFVAILDDLKRGVYVRTLSGPGAGATPDEAAASPATPTVVGGANIVEDAAPSSSPSPLPGASPLAPTATLQLLHDGASALEGDDCISFDAVPLVTPNGDVLLRSLSFCILPRMNLLIAGPNGSGKSSIFRVLRGLWPQWGGTIVRPPAADAVFYVPQKAYLPLGTLLEQVLYPSTPAEAASRGRTGADVEAILADVSLGYLVSRYSAGLNAVEDWTEVLSGGEKQRLVFARLLYHRPTFAVLDECTSAVSIEVEGELYTTAIARGITLLTISHRKTLWKYCQWLLLLDGAGGYAFRAMSPSEAELGVPDAALSEADQGELPALTR